MVVIAKQKMLYTQPAARNTIFYTLGTLASLCILQSGIKSPEEREVQEEKWMCKLQTLDPTGINKKVKHYAKDMYTTYKHSL